MLFETAAAIRAFAEKVQHGDDEHRRWLLEAAEQFIDGKPVAEPSLGIPRAKLMKEIETLKLERATWREMAEASYTALHALEDGDMTPEQRTENRARISFGFKLLDDVYGKPEKT